MAALKREAVNSPTAFTQGCDFRSAISSGANDVLRSLNPICLDTTMKSRLLTLPSAPKMPEASR